MESVVLGYCDRLPSCVEARLGRRARDDERLQTGGITLKHD